MSLFSMPFSIIKHKTIVSRLVHHVLIDSLVSHIHLVVNSIIQCVSFIIMIVIISAVYGLKHYVDGLVQDCGNSSDNALELPQSCTKPSA